MLLIMSMGWDCLNSGHERVSYSDPGWYMSMGIQPQWNDTDMSKPKNTDKDQNHCYFVHHKSHVTKPGAKPGLSGEMSATERLSHGTAWLQRKLRCGSNTGHRNTNHTNTRANVLCVYKLCIRILKCSNNRNKWCGAIQTRRWGPSGIYSAM
jgi:hypothetical protein